MSAAVQFATVLAMAKRGVRAASPFPLLLGCAATWAAAYPQVVIPEHIEHAWQTGPLLQAPFDASGARATEIERLRTLAESAAPRERQSSRRKLRNSSSKSRNEGNATSATISTPAAAAWTLGLLEANGLVEGAKPGEARRWFLRAHELGHPLAPAGLAWCAIDGCGEAPDPAAAFPWISLLRTKEPGRADFLRWRAEVALSEGRSGPKHSGDAQGFSAGADPAAMSWLRRAARDGDVQAHMELGFEAFAAGDLARAKRHFDSIASRSPSAAYNARVVRLRQASLAPREPGSEERGDRAAATLAAARRNHRGQGVPANYTEAIRLYRLAAAEGSTEAKRMLELIYSRPAPGGGTDPVWMAQLAAADLSLPGPQVVDAAGGVLLRRDPTPLTDWLPAHWPK
jgi:TPR repeat protein